MADRRHLVLVGPTHPYTGGISQHTTRLALELDKSGHDAIVESWRAQYPKKLYRGTPTVPVDEPEIGVPSAVTATLAWYSPLSWWRAGWRNRGSRIVLSIPTAFHALPYTVISLAAGRGSTMWGIVHNVQPHEAGRLSRALMAGFLRRLDRLIVHGDDARLDAIDMGVNPDNISVTPLPSPWPTGDHSSGSVKNSGPLRALFFGTIRPYKGLDVLLSAVANTPEVTLTIAGEFWEDQKRYDGIIARLDISDRVTIIPGYLPSSRFADIFGSSDVLVLPYLSGTGSIVKDVGFRFGLPVIATQVGSIGAGIEHDKTGLVIESNSADALAAALHRASEPGTRQRWRAGVEARQSVEQDHWSHYVHLLTSPEGVKG